MPSVNRIDDPLFADRFWEKVIPVPEVGCWLWLGAVTDRGYGFVKIGGKIVKAHRIAWILTHGALPEIEQYPGPCVLHKCDTPLCVNPNHLRAGTSTDNAADRHHKRRDAKGETHGVSKLRNEDVLHIRDSDAATAVLAAAYGVDKSTVIRIRNGRDWRHI